MAPVASPTVFLGPVLPEKNEVNRVTGYSVLLVQAPGVVTNEPPRVCRRLQLLRGWSHDDEIDEVFT